MRILNVTSSGVKGSRNTNKKKKTTNKESDQQTRKYYKYVQHNYFIHLHLSYYKEPVIKIQRIVSRLTNKRTYFFCISIYKNEK